MQKRDRNKASEQLLANGKSISEKSLTSTKVRKDDLVRANALMSMAIENSKISNEKLDVLIDKKKKSQLIRKGDIKTATPPATPTLLITSISPKTTPQNESVSRLRRKKNQEK